MDPPIPDPPVPVGERARAWARLAAALTVALAVGALVGWVVDSPWLRSLAPGFQPMRANAAVALALAGLGLWVFAGGPPDPDRRLAVAVARGAALLVVLLGLTTLAEYALGLNLGTHAVPWRESTGLVDGVPTGRLPAAGALTYVFLGAALLTVDGPPGASLPQSLAGLALLMVALAVTSLLYALGPDPGALILSRISINGTAAVAALAVGILLVRAEQGWMSLLFERGPAGHAMRILMPLALATPLLLGGLVRLLERMQLYPEGVSLAVFAVGAVGIYGAAVCVYAFALQHEERGRRRVWSALLESETLKAAVLESALDAVIAMDHEGRMVDFNAAAEATFGYEKEDVLGEEIANVIVPERLRERHRAGLARYLETGETTVMGRRIEMPGLRADGTEIPLELSIAAITSFEKPVFTAYLRDITDRRRSQQELHASLREKEVLLREIHHRVKNNLQVISSLLSLEARHAGEPAVETAFRRTAGRIRSIATLHERIYGSGDVARIDMREYLGSVAGDTDRAMGSAASRLDVRVDEDLRRMDMHVAMPAGLIVGELVSNALKHAQGDSPPRVRVGLRRERGKVVLSVEDDGPGFDPEVRGESEESLGLTLVSALARQLGGSLEVGPSADLGGARVWIEVTSAEEPGE